MTTQPSKIRLFFQRYFYRTIAAEVSAISFFYDRLIQWHPMEFDTQLLLDYVECPVKQVANQIDSIPDFKENSECGLLMLNGNLNYDLDIQATLQNLRPRLSRSSRLIAILYNPYFAWLYAFATAIGIRQVEQPTTFITEVALRNLAKISGYELVRLRLTAPCPFKLLGFGDLINKLIPVLPFLRWLSLGAVAVLRPIVPETTPPSLSIIVPARNERGNIESLVARIATRDNLNWEIVFVEGHSTDGTWEEIQRVSAEYGQRLKITSFQQTGVGKSDAVRLGFSKASNQLFVILDADLSVPPELLFRFVAAYSDGLGDFINGSRLVYPIEGQAMKFLNRVGNVFFAKALSHTLGISLSDSLCGTKLMSRDAYRLIIRWRQAFGDFDPFGDFELLFPAAQLSLGVVDVPLYYRDRVYGETNIRRFYHGFLLLRMTIIGFIKIKLGNTPR